MQRGSPPRQIAEQLWLTGGAATGRTKLGCFDASLQEAGVHNANLIRVSSIVPAQASVAPLDPQSNELDIEPGTYLPAVYAFAASDEPGESVHAAVAGARLAEGYGINVEHHGRDMEQVDVRELCEDMIAEMAANRNAMLTEEQWFEYKQTTVPSDGQWGGAVAAMVYQ